MTLVEGPGLAWALMDRAVADVANEIRAGYTTHWHENRTGVTQPGSLCAAVCPVTYKVKFQNGESKGRVFGRQVRFPYTGLHVSCLNLGCARYQHSRSS